MNERKPHGWKCSGTVPQQATTVPLCMKGRDIKDKMDFWGRAKNKGNKSADHEGMTRLVSAERARRKEAGDNSTPSQMTCLRIEKSTQEASSQFTKPTRAEWLWAGPRSNWGAGGQKAAHSFSLSNFSFQNLLPFWQTTWQEQRQAGVMLLVCTHQTKPKPRLIKGRRFPLPQFPFWFSRCLCAWAISVCGLGTIMLLPKLHGNSQTEKKCLLSLKEHPCLVILSYCY